LNNGLIILDLDDTLYCEKNYIHEIINKFCLNNSLIGHNLEDLIHKFKRKPGQDTLAFFLKELNVFNNYYQDQIFDLYCHSDVKLELYDGVEFFLSTQIPDNISVAILTNGVVNVQKNKIKNLNLDALVDKVFYAREKGIKYEKPHPSSYKHVLKNYGIAPQNVVMVGDNIKNDFLGPKSMGIEAILIKQQAEETWKQRSENTKAALIESIEVCQNLLKK
jgi:putative hydrolase of the HAD superfamily